MEIKQAPPRLQNRVHRARSFYARNDAIPIYEHCHKVLKRAQEHKVVKSSAINKPGKDPNEAWKSRVLAETLLYHIVKTEGLDTAKFDLPEPLHDEHVRTVIQTFNSLYNLNERDASLPEYKALLTSIPSPLATIVSLAKVVDYAVTHNNGNHLENFINPEGHPVFRLYRSRMHAIESLKGDAKAGEKLWAPLAERLGHPPLAGYILQHAYEVNHPDIHSYVKEELGRDEVQEKIDISARTGTRLIRKTCKTLRGAGFEIEVVRRNKKLEGKIMRKLYLKIKKVYKMLKKILEKGEISPEEFIKKHHRDFEFFRKIRMDKDMTFEDFKAIHLHEFDILKIQDLIAFRVILDKFEGREIDKMESWEQNLAIEAAVKYVTLGIDTLSISTGITYRYYIDHVKKDNSYEARHIDMYTVRGNSEEENNAAARIEAQIKTTKQHWVAELGGAAHWKYLGGDEEFEEIVNDIIYAPNGNGVAEEDKQLILPIKGQSQ